VGLSSLGQAIPMAYTGQPLDQSLLQGMGYLSQAAKLQELPAPPLELPSPPMGAPTAGVFRPMVAAGHKGEGQAAAPASPSPLPDPAHAKRSRTGEAEGPKGLAEDMGFTCFRPLAGAGSSPGAPMRSVPAPFTPKARDYDQGSDPGASQWRDYKAGSWAQRSPDARTGPPRAQEGGLSTIPKDELHRYIWVSPKSEDSPAILPGWNEWMSRVWRFATDPIPIDPNPRVDKGEVKQFSQIFQPVRFALVKGCKHMDFTGNMFHGWVPSSVFLQLADSLLPSLPRAQLMRIASSVQYPVAREQSTEAGPLPHHNAIQVFMVNEQGQGLYFVRVNPALRIGDTDINLTDGSKLSPVTWVRKEKW